MLKAPAEIGPRSLPRRLGGYDVAAVDSLLAELFARYEEAWHERAFLLNRAERIERELSQGEELERRLRETLLSAQRAADEQRRSAEAEASALLDAARARADEGRVDAQGELERVRAEIARMLEVERDLRANARVLVEAALRQLAIDEQEAWGDVGEESAALREEAHALRQAETTVLVEPLPVVSAPPELEPEPEPVLPAEEDTQENALSFREEPADFEPDTPAAAGEIASPEPAGEPTRTRGLDRRSLVFSAGILVTGALVAVGIWQLSAQAGTAGTSTTPTPTAQAATSPASLPATAAEVELTGEESEAVAAAAAAPSPPAKLVLRAVDGDCWVQVRLGSSTGKILYDGFLTKGSAERFVGKRLWLRVGAPANLAVRLNGRPAEDFPLGTADVIVTADEIRTVSLG